MHLDAEVVALGMRGRERGEVFAVAETDFDRERRGRPNTPRSRRRGEYSTPYRGQSSSSARVCPEVMRPVRTTKLRIGRLRSSLTDSSRELRTQRGEVARRIVERRFPMRLRIDSAPSVTYFAQAKRTFSARHTRASAKASMSTTSPSISCPCVANESAVEHNACGSCAEHARKLDHRRRVVEWRDAARKSHAAHVHVTLREAVACHERVRGNRTAARRAEIDHQRQRFTRAADLGEPPRERGCGIDLADSGVEHVARRRARGAHGILAAMP